MLTAGLDWPNLIGGAAVASCASLLVWLVRGTYEIHVSARDLSYPIRGSWYSAEFDPKSEKPGFGYQLDGMNTFLDVKISVRLGGGVVIKAKGSSKDSAALIETRWKVIGRIVRGDTLEGTWRSTVKQTNRHGTATLKFIDRGRAVGFWTGLAGSDNPLYGYWIMSRDRAETKRIADEVLSRTGFRTFDVTSLVLSLNPGEVNENDEHSGTS